MQIELLTQLKDGTPIYLRDIRPEDKEKLSEGIKKLSRETIQHRFFVAKKGFSEDELRTLTEFDQNKHFALAAINYPEKDEGLAVARFNIDDNDSTRAEFAITVIDRMQGRGLGKLILSHLIVIAKEKGINQLYGQLKSTNTSMLALALRLDGVKAKISPEGQGILKLELTL